MSGSWERRRGDGGPREPNSVSQEPGRGAAEKVHRCAADAPTAGPCTEREPAAWLPRVPKRALRDNDPTSNPSPIFYPTPSIHLDPRGAHLADKGRDGFA